MLSPKVVPPVNKRAKKFKQGDLTLKDEPFSLTKSITPLADQASKRLS